MRISTTTDLISQRHGTAAAIRAIAAAGFDCYDFSVFDISEKNPLYRDGWQEYIAGLRRVAGEAGIVCNQSHAPFPTRKAETPQNGAYNARIFELVTRAMEAAAMLGAKAIVVHPIQHVPYADNARYLFDVNMDFYRSLAPYAKRFGIRVALENMWQVANGHIVDSTCAQASEFAAYLDTLSDDCFTGCLDLGHCGLCGHEAAGMIRALGADRIGALHIHDNDGLHDSHTIPYNGGMRWADILTALGEIGYRGDFTYEADSFIARLPDACIPDALTYMNALARRMAEIIP